MDKHETWNRHISQSSYTKSQAIRHGQIGHYSIVHTVLELGTGHAVRWLGRMGMGSAQGEWSAVGSCFLGGMAATPLFLSVSTRPLPDSVPKAK